jgi:hypothetical protein
MLPRAAQLLDGNCFLEIGCIGIWDWLRCSCVEWHVGWAPDTSYHVIPRSSRYWCFRSILGWILHDETPFFSSLSSKKSSVTRCPCSTCFASRSAIVGKTAGYPAITCEGTQSCVVHTCEACFFLLVPLIIPGLNLATFSRSDARFFVSSLQVMTCGATSVRHKRDTDRHTHGELNGTCNPRMREVRDRADARVSIGVVWLSTCAVKIIYLQNKFI